MKILVTILNESQLHTALHLDGMSGRPYAFLWNKSLDRYAYEPKNQEEINDIFATQGVICPWHLSPVLIDGEMGKATAAKIPPFIERRLYENHTDAELLALAADIGLELQGAVGRENALRQLDAYMSGRAWGMKEPIQRTVITEASPDEITKLRDRVKHLESFAAYLDAESLANYNANLKELADARISILTSEKEVARLTKALAKAEAKAAQTRTGRTPPAPKKAAKTEPANPSEPVAVVPAPETAIETVEA